MSSPDCKRRKQADDVNPVANMLNVSPMKDSATPTGNVTTTASDSKKEFLVINENAEFFEDVARCDGFVDRTLLIEELLEQWQKPTYVMICAPSKFGKTVNLNMVRFFCEIEDKDTKTKEDVAKVPTMHELRSNPSKKMKVLLRQFEDKQYEECLILKRENIVIQHFGRHPVILFDFKNCEPENRSEAIVACAEQVRTAYLENEYLENSKEFQSDDALHQHLKGTCEMWCNYDDEDLEKLDISDVINGLKALIKSLRIHWEREPVFLVDDIDKPCVVAMRERLSAEQVYKIGSVISDVVCSILKSEDEELKLQAALVTGIIYSGLSGVDNTVKVYFLGDARFSKYYGLTAQEVDSLVRKFFGSEEDTEISEIINTINKHYNGYCQRSSSGEIQEPSECARYCLFSVLSYIQQRIGNKKLNSLNFWSDSGFLTRQFVSALKKCEDVLCDVQKLLFNDSATIQINYEKEIIIEEIVGIFSKEKVYNENAIFNFLLQQGFLAHNVEKSEENVGGLCKIYVKIPNIEIKAKYKTMFASYYKSLSDNADSKLTSCGEFFKSLPEQLKSFPQNSAEFQKSLGQLCDDLTCIFKALKCQSKATICSHILTLLKHYAGYETGELQYKVQYRDDNDKARNVFIDVWAQHDGVDLIFQVKHNLGAKQGKTGDTKKSFLAAAQDIVTFLSKKEKTEDTSTSTKAGTGRDLSVLESPRKIDKYLLIGLNVDGDGTTHMLVFPNNSDWENVIQVNTESDAAELISKYRSSK